MKPVREYFIRYKWTILALAVLASLSLYLLAVWFHGSQLIISADFWPRVNPSTFLYKEFFGWRQDQLGGVAPWDNTELLYMSSWTILTGIGLSLLQTEHLWFFFVMFSVGASMYFFGSRLFMSDMNRAGRMTAAIFYMFNGWMIGDYPMLSEATILAFILAPFFAFLLKQCFVKKNTKWIVITGMTTFVLGEVGSNPASFGVFLLIVFSFVLYYFILEEKTWRGRIYCVWVIVAVVGMFTLLNSYWLEEYYYILVQSAGFSQPNQFVGSLAEVQRLSISSSLFEVLRDLGRWAFYSGEQGANYYVYFPAYEMWPMTVISVLPPIAAFSALLAYPKQKATIYVGVLAIISIFLAKGTHAPLGFVNTWLYQYIPGFLVFREPPLFFDPVTAFAYAILAAMLVNYLTNRLGVAIVGIGPSKLKPIKLKPILGCVLVFLIICTTMITAYPMLNGQVIEPNRGVLPGYRITIPSYWFSTTDWINSQPGDFKVIYTPIDHTTGEHYTFGYLGGEHQDQFLDKPLIIGFANGEGYGYVSDPYSTTMITMAYSYLADNNSQGFAHSPACSVYNM